MDNSSFTFQGHKANLERGEASFTFLLKHEGEDTSFTEKIFFPPVTEEIDKEALKRILDNLLLILGISYWKTYCPKKLILDSLSLTKEQADFWNTVYTKGLGEFFYKNNIDSRSLVQFPYEDKVQVSSAPLGRKNRSLLPFGGGKDSVVAAQLLLEQDKPFDLMTVNSTKIQVEIAKLIGKEPTVITRVIDPKLLSLNKKEGVLNGHIPISAVYGFLAILSAFLYDYRYVILPNERSANFGNVEYLEEVVNHQWSKSFEFEKLFQEYVFQFVATGIHYFSLLRPFTELSITKRFTKYPKYFSAFSSCNTNFKILKQVQDDKTKWCGECPKCAFVFLALAAFLPKDKVVDIFGKNLFADEKLLPIFRQLLGIEDTKPFECVGTPQEVQLAMFSVERKGEFAQDIIIKMFAKDVLPKISHPGVLEKEAFSQSDEHLIPEEFREIVSTL